MTAETTFLVAIHMGEHAVVREIHAYEDATVRSLVAYALRSVKSPGYDCDFWVFNSDSTFKANGVIVHGSGAILHDNECLPMDDCLKEALARHLSTLW